MHYRLASSSPCFLGQVSLVGKLAGVVPCQDTAGSCPKPEPLGLGAVKQLHWAHPQCLLRAAFGLLTLIPSHRARCRCHHRVTGDPAPCVSLPLGYAHTTMVHCTLFSSFQALPTIQSLPILTSI